MIQCISIADILEVREGQLSVTFVGASLELIAAVERSAAQPVLAQVLEKFGEPTPSPESLGAAYIRKGTLPADLLADRLRDAGLLD